MEFKRLYNSSTAVDFSRITFYEIPFSFFAEWLNLVLEISKIIQPEFHVDIPKKSLDWFNFPDQEVLDIESETTYTLRTTSVILKNGGQTIHLLAQYGYGKIPGQHILVKSNLTEGSVFSRNLMLDNTIDFDINLDEKHLAAVEEVFYLFG